tara:strand:- start:49 stop:420 length:372 start_codon:yes stop_codon:yes gene_type:complete
MTILVFKDGWKNKEYKVPAISNKTDKGKWLNAYVKKFFSGDYNMLFVGTIKMKLKTTHFNIKNNPKALIGFFKNLKKLKQHHFEGEVFNSHLGIKYPMEVNTDAGLSGSDNSNVKPLIVKEAA